MIIKTIDLAYYRNYNRFHIELDPSMNIIIGPNGIGKTNILESLVMISNTKSFRTNDDSELIKKGENHSRIDVAVDNNLFKIIINEKGKILYLNRNLIKRTSDYIGRLNVVLFKPNDIELFSDSPKSRRRLLDIEIGKVSHKYLNSIVIYNKLLKDRNNLLKNERIDSIYLETINKQMIEHIVNIINFRKEMLDFINLKISDYFYRLSNKKIEIKIEYIKCCDATKDDVSLMFEKSKEKDLLYHYTTSGPQKDDFIFYFNGNNITSFASQGQKRMATIAFKLSLIDYIKNKINTNPILLLDDILSELDIDNKQRLLDIIPDDIQTIITSTDVDGIHIDTKHKIFRLRKENVNEQ